MVDVDAGEQEKRLVQVDDDANDRYKLTIFWSEATDLI